LRQSPGDQLVPGFARARLYDPRAVVFVDQPHAGHLHLEHQPAQVTGQHDVAAAPQHQPLQTGQLRVGQDGPHVGLFTDAHQTLRAGQNPERVVGLQGEVVLDLHGTIVAFHPLHECHRHALF